MYNIIKTKNKNKKARKQEIKKGIIE